MPMEHNEERDVVPLYLDLLRMQRNKLQKSDEKQAEPYRKNRIEEKHENTKITWAASKAGFVQIIYARPNTNFLI